MMCFCGLRAALYIRECTTDDALHDVANCQQTQCLVFTLYETLGQRMFQSRLQHGKMTSQGSAG